MFSGPPMYPAYHGDMGPMQGAPLPNRGAKGPRGYKDGQSRGQQQQQQHGGADRHQHQQRQQPGSAQQQQQRKGKGHGARPQANGAHSKESRGGGGAGRGQHDKDRDSSRDRARGGNARRDSATTARKSRRDSSGEKPPRSSGDSVNAASTKADVQLKPTDFPALGGNFRRSASAPPAVDVAAAAVAKTQITDVSRPADAAQQHLTPSAGAEPPSMAQNGERTEQTAPPPTTMGPWGRAAGGPSIAEVVARPAHSSPERVPPSATKPVPAGKPTHHPAAQPAVSEPAKPKAPSFADMLKAKK